MIVVIIIIKNNLITVTITKSLHGHLMQYITAVSIKIKATQKYDMLYYYY